MPQYSCLLAVGVCAVNLAGCASITALPLEPDGYKAVANAAPGFRYYLPRPYLLVAEMPAAVAQTREKSDYAPAGGAQGNGGGGGDGGGVAGKGPARAAAVPSTGKDKTASLPDSNTSVGSAPATDTSFIATNGTTYMAKLIYLPDYSKPMAVTLDTGLVGISSVQMSLQDGWMLTSVSANADNSKMADVLTAAIQALAGGATGGASKATSAASAARVATLGNNAAKPQDRSLRPGLYAFDYSYGISRVFSLCAITFFGQASTAKDGPPLCGPDVSRPSFSIVSALANRPSH